MPITALLYGDAFVSMCNSLTSNLNGNANIKVSLHTNTYVPDQSADIMFSDVSDELVDPSYPAGGVALTGVTVTQAAKVTTLNADDVTFPALSGTFRYAIIRDATTGIAATEPVLGYVKFAADVTPTSDNYTIVWHASGISTATAA